MPTAPCHFGTYKITDIEKLTELPKFVRLLAEHSGQLVNYSQFGGSINVSHKTGQRYVALLEQVFLVATLQPWYTNALKRIAFEVLSLDRSELLRGIRSVHIRHSRTESREAPVGDLVHRIFYRAVEPGLGEIIRVLHERMEPSRHVGQEIEEPKKLRQRRTFCPPSRMGPRKLDDAMGEPVSLRLGFQSVD
ncbi:hypothetical protein MHY1_p00123 (plasmid) [Methylovirgula sp. HY1]|nr:hypothetical protein MHY1_p00123 [Methylovirgula sp. HY1]